MSMNLFRLAGDMSHVFSILLLLWRVRVDRNAQGISLRTHELYLLVFITRYLDLFTSFYSVYNTWMKILFLGSTASIIYTIRFQEPIKSTYEKNQDSFLHYKFAVWPCSIIALITHLVGSGFKKFDLMELLWTFSIYLESIAMLPQLIVLRRCGEVDNLTKNYVFFMGAYRALYIVSWIYRAHTEKGYKHHWVVYFCGVLQTLLYADFFYYYCVGSWCGPCILRKIAPGEEQGENSVPLLNAELHEENDTINAEEGLSIEERCSANIAEYI